MKRELYKIPIERVEDPALQRLFQEKQEELELKLTMLRDRDTPRFLPESLQLFGGVNDDLVQLATGLLDRLPTKSHGKKRVNLTAAAFAERAEQEFDFYRRILSGIQSQNADCLRCQRTDCVARQVIDQRGHELAAVTGRSADGTRSRHTLW